MLFYPQVAMLEHCAPPGSALVRNRNSLVQVGVKLEPSNQMSL